MRQFSDIPEQGRTINSRFLRFIGVLPKSECSRKIGNRVRTNGDGRETVRSDCGS